MPAYKTLLKLLPRLEKEILQSLPGQERSTGEAQYKSLMLAAFACGRQDENIQSYLEKLLLFATELTALAGETYPPLEFRTWLKVSGRHSAQIKQISNAFETNFGTEVQAENFPSIVFECHGALRRKDAVKALSRADKQTEAGDHISFTQILTPPWVVEVIYNRTLAQDDMLKKSLSELKDFSILDPCSGTGNFLIAALHRLCKSYSRLGAGQGEAIKLALANNLFAAEIDSRALSIYILRLSAILLKTADASALLPERLNIACTAENNLQTTSNDQMPGNSQILTGSRLPDDSQIAKYSGSPENSQPSGSPRFKDNCRTADKSPNLGSLDLSLAPHILKRNYDLVVTNPPYLGRRLLDRSLKAALKNQFPDCNSDLSLCFLDRAMNWAKPDGKIGFITQASLLHLPSSKELRRKILSLTTIDCIIECGANVFPLISGEKVDNIILTLKKAPPKEHLSRYLNLTTLKEKAPAALKFSRGETVPAPKSEERAQSDFSKNEDLAFNFHRPLFLSRLTAQTQSLGDLAVLKQGLATSDNERFLRYTWEVEPELIGSDWFNYCKGQGSRRWYAPRETVIYYKDSGAELKQAVLAAYPYLKGKSHWVVKNEEYYFRAGLTFTLISAGALAVRKMPEGSIFDVGGSAIFASAGEEDFLFAYLNSDMATAFARDINPTINYQVGDLKKIPIPQVNRSMRAKLAQLALDATQAAETITRLREPHFFGRLERESGSPYRLEAKDYEHYCSALTKGTARLSSIEAEINELVFAAWANNLGGQEKEALRNWMPGSQNKQKFEPVQSDTYLLMVLASALVKAKTACSLNSDTVLSQLTGLALEFEPDFIKRAAPQGLLIFLKERLLKYLCGTYNHQPPTLALEEAGILHIFPSELILKTGNFHLDDGHSISPPLESSLEESGLTSARNTLIARLKQKCPGARRARDILKVL